MGKLLPIIGGNTVPEEEFPWGFVQCETCKAKYCSMMVYLITHAPGSHEFRCPCGPKGLYLRWKKDFNQSPEPPLELPPQNWARRFQGWLAKFIKG